MQLVVTADFNSRTHVECDDVSAVIFHGKAISTHALTWSATGAAVEITAVIKNFNSRTHVECDSKYCIKKRFTTQYMGIYCFLSSIILIFFIYSKK